MTRRLAQTADNQALTYGTTAVSLRAGWRTCLCVLAAAQLVTHSECGVGRRHPPMFAHAILCPGGFADSAPSPPGHPAGKATSCTVISSAEASAALGQDVKGPVRGKAFVEGGVACVSTGPACRPAPIRISRTQILSALYWSPARKPSRISMTTGAGYMRSRSPASATPPTMTDSRLSAC